MCIELSICIAAVSFPLGLCTTCTLATTTTLGVAAAGTFTAVTGAIAALLAGILGVAAAAIVVVLAILCAPVIAVLGVCGLSTAAIVTLISSILGICGLSGTAVASYIGAIAGGAILPGTGIFGGGGLFGGGGFFGGGGIGAGGGLGGAIGGGGGGIGGAIGSIGSGIGIGGGGGIGSIGSGIGLGGGGGISGVFSGVGGAMGSPVAGLFGGGFSSPFSAAIGIILYPCFGPISMVMGYDYTPFADLGYYFPILETPAEYINYYEPYETAWDHTVKPVLEVYWHFMDHYFCEWEKGEPICDWLEENWWRSDADEWTIFFPDSNNTNYTNYTKDYYNNDTVKMIGLPSSNTVMEAKASCSVKLETAGASIFDYVVEDEKPEEKVSAVFTDSLTSVLEEENDDSSSSVHTTTTRQSEGDTVYDIYFTVQKTFSCENQNEPPCEEVLNASTEEFIQSTKATLEEAVNDGQITSIVQNVAHHQHAYFMEQDSDVNSINCS
eukprot:CAMPEP_0178971222 /NCGR_PEP_ID=MMETSP0789-20121207/20123_1 /TAXON_ID=3005 /ORGANISM="Rhizosolenia setigera, Strain CCMP 1694" /LENGTH=495 /DNA_ID=CAMNT_0020658105 /DNA_START=50 /DNA_END=1537 /DNA_ORIENTATION=-